MGKNKLIEHESLPVYYQPLTRRLFIKTSSSILALPFMTSLLPKKAWGAATEEQSYRKFVAVINQHGGHWLDAHPKNIAYNQIAPNLRAGRLSSGQLGPIYDSSYNSLKNKMSVLVGLHSPGAIGHFIAVPLAASFGNIRNGSNGVNVNSVASYNPKSMDVLIGEKIYPAVHNVKCLRFGGYSFSNQNRISGTDINGAYDLIMSNLDSSSGSTPPEGNGGPSSEQKKLERRLYSIERTLASLSETKKSRRMSVKSRSQIDNYQQVLAQARDSYKASVEEMMQGGSGGGAAQAAKTCGDLKKPSSTGLKAEADLIVAALSCGVTRLATMGLPSEHHYVHRVNSSGGRSAHLSYLKNDVLPHASYLMNQMDSVTETNNKTLLDNSAVLVTSTIASSKMDNHNGVDMRVLVGGGLNGALRTGEAIDFRNEHVIVKKSDNSQIEKGRGTEEDIRAGRVYNELLISIMRAFGLNQSDYSTQGNTGFGNYHIEEAPFATNPELTPFAKVLNQNSGDGTQTRLLKYMKDSYLKNYNRDTVLPYYYKG